MIINVGTKNPAKIEGAREALQECEYFKGVELFPINVDSEVRKQPFGFRDVKNGANNRARNAYNHESCDYGIGIESGLIILPNNRNRYHDLCISSIYDGNFYHHGISAGFEVPKKVIKIIKDEKVDMGEACQIIGLAEDDKIGEKEGIVGILTNGLIDRKTLTKQAMRMMLTRFHRPDLYK